jgi:TrpR-related protein YerC/YecD
MMNNMLQSIYSSKYIKKIHNNCFIFLIKVRGREKMRDLDAKTKSLAVDMLFEGILSLENLEDCYRFFEDLCTVNELKEMSERLQVAKFLWERKTYIDIQDRTGASTATISRINRYLNYGNDGYKIVIERLKEGEKR